MIGLNNGNGINPLITSTTNDLNYLRDVTWYNVIIYGGNEYQTPEHTVSDFIDINGDGLPDRVSKQNGSTDVHIKLNLGNGVFSTNEIIWQTTDTNALRHVSPDPGSISNNGNTFNENIFYAPRHIESDFIDMNGDGLPDRVEKTDGSSLKVWKNNGNGFEAFPEIWLCPDGSDKAGWLTEKSGFFLDEDADDILNIIVLADTQTTYIDMNGDGLPDRVQKIAGGDFKIWFNNGHGFDDPVTWAAVKGDHDDYNLFDMWYYTDKNNPANWGPPILVASLIDMNGDGLPDRVLSNGNGTLNVYLNTGNGFSSTPIIWTDNTVVDNRHGLSTYMTDGIDSGTFNEIFDIDGDGLPDRIAKKDNAFLSTPGQQQSPLDLIVNRNQNGPAGKLKTVYNSNGGSTAYTYKSLDKTKNPSIKPAMWVLDTIKVCDGITYTNPDTTALVTKYSFEKGKYDNIEKEFYGFGQVTTTSPTGDYVVTTYDTSDEYHAGDKLEEITYNSSGAIFDDTKYTYNTLTLYDPIIPSQNQDMVQYVFPYRITSAIYDGNSTASKFIKTENYISFSVNANDTTIPVILTCPTVYSTSSFITKSTVINYGQVDSTFNNDIGYDTVTTVTTHYNDPTHWIIGLELEKAVYGYGNSNGNNTSGVTTIKMQGQTKNIYYGEGELQSGNSVINGIAVHGQLLKQTLKDSTGSSTNPTWVNPLECFYDSYGNATLAQDPNNNLTYTIYDTVYHAYPIETISSYNVLNHITEYKYDPYMRVVIVRKTAVNHITNYDVFGRVVESYMGTLSSVSKPDVIIKYYEAAVYPNGNIINPAHTATLRKKDFSAAAYSGNLNISGYIASYTYVDGLGRTIQTKTDLDGTNMATVDTYYGIGTKGIIGTTGIENITKTSVQYSTLIGTRDSSGGVQFTSRNTSEPIVINRELS